MEIRILSHDYRMKMDATLLERENRLGTCNMVNGEILIYEDLKLSAMQEVILHEILEAANFHHEYGLTHSKLSSMAASLLSILKENPELARWLINKKARKSAIVNRCMLVGIEEDMEVLIEEAEE
jgi:hypothetical protein